MKSKFNLYPMGFLGLKKQEITKQKATPKFNVLLKTVSKYSIFQLVWLLTSSMGIPNSAFKRLCAARLTPIALFSSSSRGLFKG